MKEVVVIFDPEIDVDKYGEISIPDYEYGSGIAPDFEPSIQYSKEAGSYSPLVDINGVLFDKQQISDFKLTVGNFLPSIDITVIDDDKKLQSYASLTDIIVKVFIRSRNKDFKPIRQNYKIVSSDSYEANGHINISMHGILFIDKLYSDTVKSYSQMSSFDTFQEIAKELELGFAANEFTTNDVMTRICPNISLLEFIENDLSLSVYKDDNSFFKVFIDQYYYLNLVEVNQLITVKEEMSVMTNILTVIDEEYYNSAEPQGEAEEFFLTNITSRSWSSGFLSNYTFTNNVGSALFGYGDKLYIQEYSINAREYKEFFINPLVTEGIDDTYATTETIDPVTKTLHVGEQMDDNVHKNFYFAKANNELNNQNLTKFNLNCSLRDINTQVRCYQITPVIIEEKDTERLANEEQKEIGNEGIVIDRFLSGFYVSTQVEYVYDGESFYNNVICSKREFKKQNIEKFAE